MKIKDILIPGLKTISPQATMVEAERLLKAANIRHLPVAQEGRIVGMITDSDVHRASTLIKSETGKETHIQSFKTVTDYMTSPVLRMKASEPVEKLVREMIRRKISCFIIDDDQDNSIGIITTEDLLILLLDKLNSGGPLRGMSRLLGRLSGFTKS